EAFNSGVIDSWNTVVDFFTSLFNGTLGEDLLTEGKQIANNIKDEAVAAYNYHTTKSIGQQINDFGNYLTQPERVADVTIFLISVRNPLGGSKKDLLKVPDADIPNKKVNRSVTEANSSNTDAARTNTATRTKSATIKEKKKVSLQSEAIVKQKLVSQLAPDEILMEKPRFYIQKGGMETYTVPDFAIYNTSTNKF